MGTNSLKNWVGYLPLSKKTINLKDEDNWGTAAFALNIWQALDGVVGGGGSSMFLGIKIGLKESVLEGSGVLRFRGQAV